MFEPIVVVYFILKINHNPNNSDTGISQFKKKANENVQGSSEDITIIFLFSNMI